MQKRNVGGRPPKEIATKLSKSINIKFSEHDFCNLIERAKAANVTPTAYARSMVLSGRVVAPYTAEELKLMRALAGEANNLNQLAKHLNSGDKLNAIFAKSIISRLQKLFYDSKKH